MPSSMTHTYFGMDLLDKISNRCRNKVIGYEEYFKLFCQGSDPFMFNHFFVGKKSKTYKDIQYIMHTTKTREFFISMVKSIYDNKLSNNKEVMSYLYGYICHYYLDLYTHPFIDYKSGKFISSDKDTYKYNGVHQEIEFNIDLYMIENREKINPVKYKIYKKIFNVNNFSKELDIVIKDSIEKVYGFNDISKKYLESIKYMKAFFRMFCYDPIGIKLMFYKLVDKITPKSVIRIEELSYHHNYKKDMGYLNLKHLSWNYPWDKDKKFNTSFFDLYDLALKDAIKTIEKVTVMLDNNKLDVELLNNLFKNLSLSTGLPCEEKVDYKYFEF